jgi:hypothetical protein
MKSFWQPYLVTMLELYFLTLQYSKDAIFGLPTLSATPIEDSLTSSYQQLPGLSGWLWIL